LRPGPGQQFVYGARTRRRDRPARGVP